jgi:hypothetical protein
MLCPIGSGSRPDYPFSKPAEILPTASSLMRGTGLGAEELVSFDSKAISVLEALGSLVRLLS